MQKLHQTRSVMKIRRFCGVTIVHEDTHMGGRIRPLGRATFGLTLIPYRNFGTHLMGSADFSNYSAPNEVSFAIAMK